MAIPGLSADAIVSIVTEEGDFLVISMSGHEHLSELYEFNVELASTSMDLLGNAKETKLLDLLGTRATVEMDVSDDPRYFDGFVTRAARGERRGRYQTYTLTLQPWIWFMTRTKNSRVFQEKSVKDIITELLKDYSTDSDWRLVSASMYPPLDYCVQHNETDFNFFSRLLEEVGIYYFFEHDKGKHTLVLIDAMAKHKSRDDSSAINWGTEIQSAPTIKDWHVSQETRSITATLTEYDYLAPTTAIKGTKDAADQPETLGSMEWFEHPALVAQNSAKAIATDVSSPASQRATVRMEELLALSTFVNGTTNTRDLSPGKTFELAGAPTKSDNQHYLMVNAIYSIDFADHEAIDELATGRRHEGFRVQFTAISISAPNYRSPRTAHKPVIGGPQTAIVVGASGNEIETDKHGRIKVKFFWDRDPKKDQTSSCWVRVAQPWAGKGFGMFSLPRVGHEVVVQFIDGDPDRPLVTGSVYNNDNRVAWLLPDRSTFTGLKTQSSKGGTADNANELRFEDKKDSEYIWFNAEKDFYRIVEHDAFDHIGNNETVKVMLTRKEVIGENWFMDITKDVMHNMGKDLHVNVAGDIFYTGGATFQLDLEKDFNSKIGGDLGLDVAGKAQLKVQDDIALHTVDGKISLKSGNTPTTGSDILVQGVNVKIKAGATIVLEAMTGITLKVGGSLINIGPGGIDIVGTPLVKVNSGGGGGSASPALSASPVAPTKAKKEDSTTAAKKDDYEALFKDPTADDAKPS